MNITKGSTGLISDLVDLITRKSTTNNDIKNDIKSSTNVQEVEKAKSTNNGVDLIDIAGLMASKGLIENGIENSTTIFKNPILIANDTTEVITNRIRGNVFESDNGDDISRKKNNITVLTEIMKNMTTFTKSEISNLLDFFIMKRGLNETMKVYKNDITPLNDSNISDNNSTENIIQYVTNRNIVRNNKRHNHKNSKNTDNRIVPPRSEKRLIRKLEAIDEVVKTPRYDSDEFTGNR